MPKIEVQQFNTIDRIQDPIFKELGCSHSFYFSKLFLRAFEYSNKQIVFSYLLFRRDNSPLALAIIQKVNASIKTNLSSPSQKLFKQLDYLSRGQDISITICGNLFLSGAYGLWIKNPENTIAIYKMLSRKLNTTKINKRSKFYILKDFNGNQVTAIKKAVDTYFNPFKVEPNMRLQLRWKNYESYKLALKAKYRNKINKADARSAELKVSSLNADQIQEHREQLQSLFTHLTDHTSFRTAHFQVETYALLKQYFPHNIYVYSYVLNNHIVGFSTSFLVGNKLDAHYIGFVPELNKKFAIYPRILNDYLKLGYRLGVQEVNFGRTSSEIKSTLGALPEDLTCYVRHRSKVIHRILPFLLQNLELPMYRQHNPFKKD